VDLSGYLSILRRRWPVLLACLAIGLVVSIALTATAPKNYRASARLFVNIPAATDVREALQGVQLSAQLLESYAAIATSRTSAEAIAEEVGGGVTASDVRSRLSAIPQPDTLLIDVVVLDTDRERARATAEAAAATLSESIRDLGPSPERAVEARVIDPAVVTGSPVSPSPVRDVGAGLALGLVAGVLLAFLFEALFAGPDEAAPATGAAPDASATSNAAIEARLTALAASIDDLRVATEAAIERPARRRPARESDEHA
jgi:receptor protein-tyrosine kinase